MENGHLRPLSSVEKLEQLISEGGGLEPTDPQTGQMLGILKTMGPLLRRFLPSDPDELDELLIGGVSLALRLRSDDAEPPPPFEVLMAEPVLAEGIEEPI